MGEFVRVTGTTDVKPGHGIVAEVNGKILAVFDAREARDKRERRELKFAVQGSQFRKPRSSDLELSRLARLARPACLARLGSSS
jgi:hypothetical protein